MCPHVTEKAFLLLCWLQSSMLLFLLFGQLLLMHQLYKQQECLKAPWDITTTGMFYCTILLYFIFSTLTNTNIVGIYSVDQKTLHKV